jgi:DNA polymerase-3 subunit gamma/tau
MASNAPSSALADWPSALAAMKLSGMARQLAQNCELVGECDGVIELRLAESYKHLLQQGPQERLRSALEEHVGRTIRLKIGVGQPVGMTPAQMDEQERRKKLAHAARSLDSDPFVRDLVENLGARVVPDSIKPQR